MLCVIQVSQQFVVKSLGCVILPGLLSLVGLRFSVAVFVLPLLTDASVGGWREGGGEGRSTKSWFYEY